MGDFLNEFKQEIITRTKRVGEITEAVSSQSLIHDGAIRQVQATTTDHEVMRMLFEALEIGPSQHRVSFHLILRMNEPDLIHELGKSFQS